MGEALGAGIGSDMEGVGENSGGGESLGEGSLGKGIGDMVEGGFWESGKGGEYVIATCARKITIAIPSKKPKIASLFLISISN